MYYVVQSRKNPRDPQIPPKYYLIARSIENIGLEAITEEIALATSLTRGDVDNTIKSLLDIIPKYLKMGFNVNLGEFGSYRLTMRSEGSDESDEAVPAKVTHIRPVFTPSPKLRKEISDAPVHKYPDI